MSSARYTALPSVVKASASSSSAADTSFVWNGRQIKNGKELILLSIVYTVILSLVGVFLWSIYEVQHKCNDCQDMCTGTNMGIYYPSTTCVFDPSYQNITSHTNTTITALCATKGDSAVPTLRLYNFATSVIPDSVISSELLPALTLQLQRDLPPLWNGMTANVVFQPGSNTVQHDGSWPLILLNQNLGYGLGYHTISQSAQYNPAFISSLSSDIPYAVIQVPAICKFGMTSDQCIFSTSLVVSHEALEILINPTVDGGRFWQTIANPTDQLTTELSIFAEIADPVQGQIYYASPSLTRTPMQNFVTPNWFNQLSNTVANPSSVQYDYSKLLTKPGEVSPTGYIPYSNMTDGCYYNYLPSSHFYGVHNRVVQSCTYRRCTCPYPAGTIIGTDALGYSFGNVYQNPTHADILIRTILSTHL
jgi:hypothetical protein